MRGDVISRHREELLIAFTALVFRGMCALDHLRSKVTLVNTRSRPIPAGLGKQLMWRSLQTSRSGATI